MSASKTSNSRARTQSPDAASGNLPGFRKLEGRCNYETWKFAMEMYLTDCELWEYVNNPDELSRNISSIEFKRQDSKARSKICLMCHESVFSLIASAKTAKDTWNILQKEFTDSGLIERVNLLRKLFGVKLSHYPNMKAYLNDIKETQLKLAAINASIADEFLGVIMLAGLPGKQYNSLVTAIEHSGGSITSDSVTSVLLQGDPRQTGHGSRSAVRSQFTERDKPDIRCGYCKKVGHTTNRCRNLLRRNRNNDEKVDKDNSHQTLSSCFKLSNSSHRMSSSDWCIDAGATSQTSDIDWLEQVTENPQVIKIIVNSLTQENYDHSVIKLKTLLKNQEYLEVAVEIVYEKAIAESEKTLLLASMCKDLSSVKVPAENPTSPDQCVNFRALLISMCQAEFIVTNKVDDQVIKLEEELAECRDPYKKKELELLIKEANRRVRIRSIGNVRFIGELYKLNLLTFKIILFCMNNLIEREDKELESLCMLLITAGQKVENEGKEQVDAVFRKMHEIVKGRETNKVSSRVRFLIQDVIDLSRKGWAIKNVAHLQRKILSQVKDEANHNQRQVEETDSKKSMKGRFRRDDNISGKIDSYIQKTKRDSYRVCHGVVTQNKKDESNVKLGPQSLSWSEGSGTKNSEQAENNSSYSKGASIEKSFFEWSESAGGGAENRPGSSGADPYPRRSSTTIASNVGSSIIRPPLPQRPLPEDKKKFVKSIIDLCLINPNDDEMVAAFKERIGPQYQAALVTEIVDIVVERSPKEIKMISKSMLNLVSTDTVLSENLVLGLNDIFEYAPDLIIDVPMLYEYLAQIIVPQLEKMHLTYKQLVVLSKNIISANQGHLLLKALIKCSKDSMGPSTKSKWLESELQLEHWVDTEELDQLLDDRKSKFSDNDRKENEDDKKEKENVEETKEKETQENKKILTPSETHSKLLQLMSSEENYDYIEHWVRDNLGDSANEDWFLKSLIQAICENAVSGSEHTHFNQDSLHKYSSLVKRFCENQEGREACCLVAVQEFIQKIEHPRGLTLEIFQYLLKQDIISVNGFKEWEKLEVEPEGEGLMIKALISFYANIKNADI